MWKHSNIIPPTLEEDEAINRGIAADPDTYELSQDEIKAMHRMHGQLASKKSGIQGASPVDSDIVDAFKVIGPNWKKLMNNALREWLKKHHRPA